MQRAAIGARFMSGVLVILADSFRDAYVGTGMNLVQSIALCAVHLGRRGWRAVRGPSSR
jgi:hypothetical protein